MFEFAAFTPPPFFFLCTYLILYVIVFGKTVLCMCTEYHVQANMYYMSAQGINECMINAHDYIYYYISSVPGQRCQSAIIIPGEGYCLSLLYQVTDIVCPSSCAVTVSTTVRDVRTRTVVTASRVRVSTAAEAPGSVCIQNNSVTACTSARNPRMNCCVASAARRTARATGWRSTADIPFLLPTTPVCGSWMGEVQG